MTSNQAGDSRPPRPTPSPERITNTRKDSDLRHFNEVSVPTPEPEPTVVTESRGEAAHHRSAGPGRSTLPTPEPDRKTAVRGEEVRNRITSYTQVRGEGDDDDGNLTHSRGEQPAQFAHATGTFSREDTDVDQSRAVGYDPGNTETKQDRGDADFNAALIYDPANDAPSDTRRITALGIIAARQEAAKRS